jgi:hypothetical protein
MNEIMMHATTWTNLGNIMPNEVSQGQKNKYYCMILLT